MNEEENRPFNAEQGTEPDKSPAEKLQSEREAGHATARAENPESKEIKKEINPNTEYFIAAASLQA